MSDAITFASPHAISRYTDLPEEQLQSDDDRTASAVHLLSGAQLTGECAARYDSIETVSLTEHAPVSESQDFRTPGRESDDVIL
ncbi:hypothetical protein WCQ02_37755 [Paraburkholderia tropica]|nr:hypothetical protein [Paraburkholderia tropica]